MNPQTQNINSPQQQLERKLIQKALFEVIGRLIIYKDENHIQIYGSGIPADPNDPQGHRFKQSIFSEFGRHFGDDETLVQLAASMVEVDFNTDSFFNLTRHSTMHSYDFVSEGINDMLPKLITLAHKISPPDIRLSR